MHCHKISLFIHKMAKTYPFSGRGFHTSVEWKIGYKVINKQMIVHILIVNTAFYIYGNIRLKEISILNWFEQIQENIIAGSAFSARLGFHTRPSAIRETPVFRFRFGKSRYPRLTVPKKNQKTR